VFFARRPRPGLGSIVVPKWHKVEPGQKDVIYAHCKVVVDPSWERCEDWPSHQKACWQCFGKGST
jgi:hypothetical protein